MTDGSQPPGATQPDDRPPVDGAGRAEARLRSVLEHAPVGMALASPSGRLLEVNPSLAVLLGRERDDLRGGTLFDVTHPDDLEAAQIACDELWGKGGRSRESCRFVHADGHVLDVVVHTSSVVDVDDEPDYVVFFVEDVTARNSLHSQLREQALTDPLTALPNRQLLWDRLEQAVHRRERSGGGLAVLFADIDGFKDVNDRSGHAAGDRVLCSVAACVRDAVRPGDTAARFGGDEFVVLCEGVAGDAARSVAHRLIRAVSTLRPGADRQAVTVSVGLAIVEDGVPVDARTLVDRADDAMYEAKRAGPGNCRVSVFPDPPGGS